MSHEPLTGSNTGKCRAFFLDVFGCVGVFLVLNGFEFLQNCEFRLADGLQCFGLTFSELLK